MFPKNNNGKQGYLILKAWADPMENEVSAAFGYKPFAITMDKAVAKKYYDDAQFTSKSSHGWAGGGKPSIKVELINII